MHGLAAARLGEARLGETELAVRFFQETAAIDLADTHVAIAGGVHIAALGGLGQIAGPALQRPVAQPSPADRDRPPTHGLTATLVAGPAMDLFIGGEQHDLSRELPLRLVAHSSSELTAA
jgi:hypothetical protein